MMMVKNFKCPVLRTSFSEAGPGFVARYKLDICQRKSNPAHSCFCNSDPAIHLEMFFLQALSGMASKVPFTEDRVALAGGW